MNEEVSKDSIRFAFHYGAKPTARLLWRALKAFIQHKKNKIKAPKHGKQSVKKLIGQGQGATSMEISGESMRKFKRIANKYGVDFAIVKDKTADPPRYTVFFKAKDMDAISAVAKEYSAKVVKMQDKEKPSLLQELRRYKEIVAKIPHKVKEKVKEQAR